MKDPQNITIAILVAAAVVLSVMLIVTVSADPAQAAAAGDRGGDYIMIAAQLSTSQDLLYVIDLGMRRMVVYEVNIVKNSLDLIDRVTLEDVFK